MADDDGVDHRDLFDLHGTFCVSLWTHEGDWGASWLEDWVEEDAQAAGELDVVAGVA